MKIKKGLILTIMSFVFLWLPTAPVVAQQGTGKEVIAPLDVADKKDSRAQDDTRKRRKPRIMVVVHSMEISNIKNPSLQVIGLQPNTLEIKLGE